MKFISYLILDKLAAFSYTLCCSSTNYFSSLGKIYRADIIYVQASVICSVFSTTISLSFYRICYINSLALLIICCFTCFVLTQKRQIFFSSMQRFYISQIALLYSYSFSLTAYTSMVTIWMSFYFPNRSLNTFWISSSSKKLYLLKSSTIFRGYSRPISKQVRIFCTPIWISQLENSTAYAGNYCNSISGSKSFSI